jgi:zinc protease
VFTGPFVYNRANQYAIGALSDVLGIRLREVLREQLGGTYTVGVDGAGAKYPRPEYTFSVSFGSAPERVDQLVKAVFTQIDSLKRYGPSKELVEKVRETERRERETALKQNGFWLGQLVTADRNGLDIDDVPNFEKMLATLSPTLIQSAAKQYLRTNNYVRVSLYPESYRVTGK